MAKISTHSVCHTGNSEKRALDQPAIDHAISWIMFEIYQSPKNKEFYFGLKAKNNQIILASEGYKTKASCKAGIKSVKKNAARSERS